MVIGAHTGRGATQSAASAHNSHGLPSYATVSKMRLRKHMHAQLALGPRFGMHQQAGMEHADIGVMSLQPCSSGQHFKRTTAHAHAHTAACSTTCTSGLHAIASVTSVADVTVPTSGLRNARNQICSAANCCPCCCTPAAAYTSPGKRAACCRCGCRQVLSTTKIRKNSKRLSYLQLLDTQCMQLPHQLFFR